MTTRCGTPTLQWWHRVASAFSRCAELPYTLQTEPRRPMPQECAQAKARATQEAYTTVAVRAKVLESASSQSLAMLRAISKQAARFHGFVMYAFAVRSYAP